MIARVHFTEKLWYRERGVPVHRASLNEQLLRKECEVKAFEKAVIRRAPYPQDTTNAALGGEGVCTISCMAVVVYGRRPSHHHNAGTDQVGVVTDQTYIECI